MNKWWTRTNVLIALAISGGLLLITPVWAGGAGPLLQSTSARQDTTDALIIKLREPRDSQALSMSSAQVRGLSATAGIGLTHFRAMSGNAQVMKLPRQMAIEEVEAIARRVSADPQVEYAEPDRIMRPLLVPNDTRYTDQWHYHPSATAPGGANLPAAWDVSTGSTSIVVAVIDTGLVPHADIDSDILDGAGQVVSGYDFISDAGVGNDGDGRDANPTDAGDWTSANECSAGSPARNSSWHGTHVAGTIGALSNNNAGVAGVNWSSKILPVRVLGKCGGFVSDITDGMRWAAGLSVSGVPANANPARVLSLSLGGGGACSTTFQTAIDAIVAAGAVVVVAAGNDNANASGFEPASCANVISVAAVNRNGGRADYSNFGTAVDIAAPGGEQTFSNDPNGVLSTLNTGATTPVASPTGDTYIYYEGTSMAAPHIAGVVSLMLSVNSALSPASVASTLQSTARAFPTGTGRDCTTTTCGAGIVNAASAVSTASTLPIVNVSATDAAAAETGLDPGTFTITRTGATGASLAVNYSMSGTALNGTDYTSVTGSATIPIGSATVTVTITPSDDAIFENTETVILTLSTNAAYGVGTTASATVTIADNEPTVTVTATDSAAAEAGLNPGTFTFTRSVVSNSVLTVNYSRSGTATNGSDYTPLTGTVSIAANSATATVTLTPVDDTIYEGNQTVILTITSNSAYGVGTPASATVTIADNDPIPPSSNGGGGCFIATAAYGTPMAEDVRYLRAFRDEYLQTNDAGRWFVKQYYEYSPSFADYLREHDSLRSVVRSALSPFVAMSKVLVSGEALAAQTKDHP